MAFLGLRRSSEQEVSASLHLKEVPLSRDKSKTVLKHRQLILQAENLQSPSIIQTLASAQQIQDEYTKCKVLAPEESSMDSVQLCRQRKHSNACHPDSELRNDVDWPSPPVVEFDRELKTSSQPSKIEGKQRGRRKILHTLDPLIEHVKSDKPSLKSLHTALVAGRQSSNGSLAVPPSTSPRPSSLPSGRIFSSPFLARKFPLDLTSFTKPSVRTYTSYVPLSTKEVTSTRLVDVAPAPETPNSTSTFATSVSDPQLSFTPSGSSRHDSNESRSPCADECDCVRCCSRKCRGLKLDRMFDELSRAQFSAIDFGKSEELLSGARVPFARTTPQSSALEAKPEVGLRPRPALKKFEPKRLSSVADVNSAKKCVVTDENGRKLHFGQLIEREGPTVVVFIRQFCWSPTSSCSCLAIVETDLAPSRLLFRVWILSSLCFVSCVTF